MTSNARTMQALRSPKFQTLGVAAALVEKWIPQARRRHDLFNLFDILAVAPIASHNFSGIIGIQATTRSTAEKIRAIQNNPIATNWLRAGGKIQIWQWKQIRSAQSNPAKLGKKKVGRKTFVPKITELTLATSGKKIETRELTY
jgi:hypothetical protein